MDRCFNCCKKDFNNYCCKVCLEIYHPSCLERRKEHVVISGYKILCSRECQKIDNDAEFREGQNARMISDRIDELLSMNREKDSYIQTMKKRATDFENEVFNTERKYVDEVNVYKAKIIDLNKEIVDYLNRNSSLQAECDKLKAGLERLGMEIGECNKSRDSMLTSIETLTEENRAYINELKQIKRDSFNLRNNSKTYKKLSLMPVVTWESRGLHKSKVGQSHSGEAVHDAGVDGEKRSCIGDIADDISRVGIAANVVTLPHETLDRKCRVLILCDESGRYICNQLRQTLKSTQFSVETIIKPNARLEDVVGNMDKLTRDFSTRDYVIVMAGKNNFLKKAYPKLRFISDRLRSCSTNVIFLSTPVYTHNRDLYKYILKFNNELNEFLQKINNFVPCNLAYIEANGLDGLKLEHCKVLDKILKEITVQKRASKNLIFIDTVNTPVGVDSSQSIPNSDSRDETEFFR